MNKLIWYLKQLLPLTYWTSYKVSVDEEVEGKAEEETVYITYFTIWKMWFGKCYNEVTVQVLNKN